MTDSTQPGFLMRDGDAVAFPALRTLAYLPHDLSVDYNRDVLVSIYEKFEARFKQVANVTSFKFDTHKGAIRWANPSLLLEAREWLKGGTILPYEGIRRYGYVVDGFEEPNLPFLSIENVRPLLLEVSLPLTDQASREFADWLASRLSRTPTIWAAQGYGFVLPPYLGSLGRYALPQSTPRYKAAIELQLDDATPGVRREGSPHRWQPGEEPGIPDIGWRTLIGREFWDRVPDVEADLADVVGVQVERSDTVLTITIGDEPIWGDVNADEDVSAYRAVAQALEPIAYPLGAARAFAFGGAHYDPAQAEKIERYFRRFMTE